MAELTLEQLADRIKVIEDRLDAQLPKGTIRLPSGHLIREGTGDRQAALEAVLHLKNYDYGALEEQDRVDLEDARKGME